LELAIAEDPSADLSSSASSDEDEEDAARNEALGLGGAKLKAVLSEINKNDVSSGASGISVKGGEVLTIIYERMQNMSGDPTATKVYGKLLTAAGRPYVEMLRAWVATGRLMDPHEELLVKESKFIDRGILDMDYTDEYWERRYTVIILFILSTLMLTLVSATRWVNILWFFKTTSSWSSTTSVSGWSTTGRRLRATSAGELETQNPVGWEISQRHSGMWDRDATRRKLRRK
jgi:hypothetical protein